MAPILTVLFTLTVILSASFAQNNKLPDDLLVGFATASYQVEGAWNEDGKGENVWDRAVHTIPNYIFDNSTGDVADDQYHKYQEDVDTLSQLGAQLYRFSLSWSRILPTGFSNQVNQPGVDYYNKLIDALLAKNIQPMVTLFHWDLPQPLQDLGGFSNPLLADWYEDYARVAFSLFGDRVKYWITFNEPLQTCHASYGGADAPGVNMPGIAEYLCTHTLLISHARAYHLYSDEFRQNQSGMVGITLNGGWIEPASDSATDIAAADRAMQFEVGWFAHPIFSTDGDYPPIMRQAIDANSAAEGRPRSRLPVFEPDMVNYIRGTYDFFGCNHYSTNLGTIPDGFTGPDPSWDRDRNVNSYQLPTWPSSASSWLKVVPWGIRRHLNFIKQNYNDPIVIITENGFSDTGEIDDPNRVDYYSQYLQEMLNAVYEDGVKVKGYTAWSSLDNFEWRRGYSERFGLIHVDFNDPQRPRTWKTSAKYFQKLIADRQLPQKKGDKWEFNQV